MATSDNEAFAAFGRRIIRAHARRVADGDIEGLAELVKLRDAVDEATRDAVRGLRSEPWCYSWADIARVLGVSTPAAWERWRDRDERTG